MEVELPLEMYRRACTTYPYRNDGIEAEIEKYYGLELDGTESFRLLGQFSADTVLIKIDSSWVQPTRS